MLEACRNPAWSSVTIDRDRQRPGRRCRGTARGASAYMRAAAARIWPHARRRASRSGVGGPPGRAGATRRRSATSSSGERRTSAGSGCVEAPPQRVRARRDRAAEEVGRRPSRARRRRAPRCSGRASPRTSVIGSVHCVLQVRPGRAVEERALQLAPAAGERDPRERGARGRRVARDRVDDGPDVERRALRVVAADALGGRARRGRAPRRRSSRASPRPDARPGACRRRARACGRPRPPARHPRAGCSRRTVGLRRERLGGASPRRSRAGSSPSRPRACCSSR